ncbi:transcription antitermination factor NusB [Risungbinella massiliensis]|uniref:transcription antitermination factor NusB n=1 Tax=Risungbinella massiliensis TaxID=1329796 RepID=UPI0005CC700F|nr:transcription antitermination factor NusB [Risungbinella massiliensis]
MSRRLARELAVQALYQKEVYPDSEDILIKDREKKLPDTDRAFFTRIYLGVEKHQSQIDENIAQFLKKSWTINRLSAVERAILRIAVYELHQEEEIPSGVILNEAVELAKRFSGVESARFVNGLLGKLAQTEQVEISEEQDSVD